MPDDRTNKTAAAILPFVTRLERHTPLGQAERDALLSLPWIVRKLETGGAVFPAEKARAYCGIVVAGLVGRCKFLPEGSRQIVAVHVKGDGLCLGNALAPMNDCAVQALNRAEAAIVPAHALERLIHAHPALRRAIWVETLAEAAIQREWTVNVGRRNARARIAHLLCEMAIRMKDAGFADSVARRIPLTQEQLADTVGLTQVHVNRTLQSLRGDGLIDTGSRPLTITDLDGLQRAARFHDDYLHFYARKAA